MTIVESASSRVKAYPEIFELILKFRLVARQYQIFMKNSSKIEMKDLFLEFSD